MTYATAQPSWIPAGHIRCSECANELTGARQPDGRGGYFTDWCLKCNGYGYVRGAFDADLSEWMAQQPVRETRTAEVLQQFEKGCDQ